MERKICFFDIDGTLLPFSGHLAPGTSDALTEAMRRGHLLFVNTGRTFYTIPQGIRQLPMTGFVSGCGTQVRIGSDILFQYHVEPSLCQETAALLARHNIPTVYEHSEGIFFHPAFDGVSMQENFRRYYQSMGLRTGTTEDPDFAFDKVYCRLDQADDLPGLRTALLPHFTWIDRGAPYCELVPKCCSKATGMALLAEHYGLTSDDCFAFGDSANDREMMAWAGTSIAMARNAGLDGVIDYVTGDAETGGVVQALRHFALI